MNLDSLLELYGFDRERFAAQRALLARTGFVSPALDEKIEALTSADFCRLPLPSTSEHQHFAALGRQALQQGSVAALLLNGGMATRFGGIAKGAARAFGERSFLDLRLSQIRKVAQAHSAKVPVVLMTSFATHEATVAHLSQHDLFGLAKTDVHYAPQGISLRLDEKGEVFHDQRVASPYAPGHGDLAWALARSGVGAELKKLGIQTLFVSNVDNLGCTLDAAVIGAHLAGRKPMTVELTDRLPDDVGGAPARVGGRIELVEGFRLPKDFPFDRLIGFNTNTFYFNWEALDPALPLNFYPVQKKVDGRTAIQFERILGEVSHFVDCQLLLVPRDAEQGRFLPVKTPDDLQRMQSLLQQRLSAGTI